FPAMTVSKLGYGAGAREQQATPNVLRAALGALTADAGTANASATADTVVELRANLDDTTPEVIGQLCQLLLDGGALDVFLTSVQTKKFRPGVLLTVLAEPPQLDALADIIFRNSTSFGLRYETLDRLKLSRRIESVQTPYGPVRVKIGEWK